LTRRSVNAINGVSVISRATRRFLRKLRRAIFSRQGLIASARAILQAWRKAAEYAADERADPSARRETAGARVSLSLGPSNEGEAMRRARGFTLIELVVVIAVLGILFTILIGITRAVVMQQRYQVTRSRMANIDTSLAIYVSQNRRLPCPADGTLNSSSANAGREISTGTTTRTCTDGAHPNAQRHGVVPWRELGLTAADAEDGWGGRFTYRVGPDLVSDKGMDFTACDPAGSNATVNTSPPYCVPGCTAGNMATCTPPTTALTGAQGKGVLVQSTNGTVVMDPNTTPSGGAAYVLISHGAEGGGAYSGDGVLQSSSVDAGTIERNNFADRQYVPPGSFLVDDVINPAAGVHFDDLVSRPGILAVAVKAGVGPRAH
jgi:prepilin-type N-terminal cleavage/methylation domain-containing protein